MSIVIPIRAFSHGRAGTEPVVPGLLRMFATQRRQGFDAFWLKENAELLQCLVASGAAVDPQVLQPYADRAARLMAELRFFPQYYRMMLSFAVDLQALGMADAPVAEMAEFIVAQDLVQGETADVHRAEARLLLHRAGMPLDHDAALAARVARFATTTSGFCLPNRRAAYELTHCVFHASHYGRVQMAPNPKLRNSLINVGILAVLETNLDLLAEVTIALRLAGEAVPAEWDAAVARGASGTVFQSGPEEGPFDDDYHEYFVLNWAMALAGKPAFAGAMPQGARLIRQPKDRGAALRELSMALLDMGESRMPDWGPMRWRLWPQLSQPTRHCIETLENLSEFPAFFAGFARSGNRGQAR